ncbi:hypothetical protein MPK71_gp298 [Erwinia phage pEa_SNUABM_1]|uniref:Uncharacterized protein n=1 Tax=Erwinia phage pEa_SNUABM_1 TaxID=2869543 RepID=A0AAE8BZX2_9CAUD|nr:hypothetical protein MPK71_gp298 [Erwinia phage pEa_SNUABM_1]QZE57507.1 hypothetical protein pEaSNUABM1_00298 [Erwinia phage pEa_SNUABM_1]
MNDITSIARSIFERGTTEQRDALRAVANTVLVPNMRLAYEFAEPTVEETYRLLEGISFTGDGKMMLPGDEIYALDNLLRKEWQKTFFDAVANMTLTMFCTDPHTAGKGFWPRNNSECCEFITRAFIWTIAQHGLTNILLRDTKVVSHTRLAQFIIALQTEGKDDGYARHFSLYDPHSDTGSITVSNLWSDEYKAARVSETIASRPPEYDDVRRMNFDDLADLCERLGLIALKSQPDCDCEDDDCECDELVTRHDLDRDPDDLREIFYAKYGDPDDEGVVDEEDWITGASLMEVEVDLPVVTLHQPEPKTNLPRASHMKKKKPMAKSTNKSRVVLRADQQIWHELDSKQEFGDRRFAITLVSRHTCGINRPVATNNEALAIAYALLALESK